MTMPSKFESVASRLAQCGTDARPFLLDSLSIAEISSFYAARIRSVRSLDPSKLIDMSLPAEIGTCHGHDPVTLCLGPNEWLRIGESSLLGNPTSANQPLDSGFYQWNETDGLGIFRVTGDAAPWLMSKNSGLDFQVSPKTPGQCVRCKFGKIAVLVFCRRGENQSGEFNLVVDRSVMKYLWTLLISTAPHAVELYDSHKIPGKPE